MQCVELDLELAGHSAQLVDPLSCENEDLAVDKSEFEEKWRRTTVSALAAALN